MSEGSDIIRELEQSWVGSGLEDPQYSNPADYWTPVEAYTFQIAMRGTRLDGSVVRTSRIAPVLTTNMEIAKHALRNLIHSPAAMTCALNAWALDEDEPFSVDCEWECVGIRLISLCTPPF